MIGKCRSAMLYFRTEFSDCISASLWFRLRLFFRFAVAMLLLCYWALQRFGINVYHTSVVLNFPLCHSVTLIIADCVCLTVREPMNFESPRPRNLLRDK